MGARSAEKLGIVSAECRGGVVSARFMQSLYESVDPRRHHKQIPRVYLIANAEPQHPLKHKPRLIVRVMHMQRRDPLPLRVAGIRPLDNHKVARRPTKLAARERRDKVLTR